MPEAVYGLLGALSGALITGAAAYWGPLQVQRRALEAEREVRAQAERERFEAAASHRRTARLSRIITIRTTAREWSDVLGSTLTQLLSGQPVELKEFDRQVTPVRNSAQSALDQALHDGIWIQQTSHPVYGPAPSHLAGMEPALTLDALGHVTDLIRIALANGIASGDHRTEELKDAYDKAQEARGRLSHALLNRLEGTLNGDSEEARS